MAATVVSVYAETDFEYPLDLERNPFDALVDKNGVINVKLVRAEGDLKINGLMYSDDPLDRIVIVNNEILHEKDIVGNYFIKRILPDRVIFDKKGKRIVLKMEEENED